MKTIRKKMKRYLVACLVLVMSLGLSACGGSSSVDTAETAATTSGSTKTITVACSGGMLSSGYTNKITITFNNSTKVVSKVSFTGVYVDLPGTGAYQVKTDTKTTYSGSVKNGQTITIKNAYISIGGSKQYCTIYIKPNNIDSKNGTATITYEGIS